jgi:penicillin amidase
MEVAVKIIKLLAALIVFALIGLAIWLPNMDSYQKSGELQLSSLQQPVTIKRDDYGIPYIYAQSLDDAITAQGFVIAQHRLFQLELFRQMSQGRLAEMIGERGLINDRLIRVLNISATAQRQVALLNDEELNFFQRYINGLNAYISQHPDEHPFMLRLLGRTPRPWNLQDIVALQMFQVWSSSVNWKQELMNQQLLDLLGAEQAAELLPVNINPDDPATEMGTQTMQGLAIALQYSQQLLPDHSQFAMGSNAWASGSRKSASGMPILSNDPHLDARNLPGIWHPMGLITPELRAVGGAFPGSPGLGNARTEHIAWGATNGYADMVDLYIEQVDPQNPANYLDGEQSVPFALREEVIKISDRESDSGFRSETLLVRETRRGPVISDHAMSTVRDKVLTLRWSVPEMLGEENGNRRLLLSTSVEEAIDAIGSMSTPLNYIVVDTAGNIARVSSGHVPLRVRGDGSIPMPASAVDNWSGRIPAAEMPMQLNPDRDWVGTANHRVTRADYPYPYSSYAAASWRYRRLMELFAKDGITSDDHWDFLMDNKNPMAQRLAPVIIAALQSDPELAELADILSQWDFMDTKEQAAPAIFQSLYRHFAWRVFADELGEELATQYLNGYYYWHEHLVLKIEENNSAWFDDKSTPAVETRDDIFRLAAHDALTELSERFGDDPQQWQWGDAHTVSFFHPLVPGEAGARWLGGGVNPADGSGETLNRALYVYDDPQNTKIIPSTRIVIDLSDPDKIEAHIPGGVSERLFDTHQQDSLPLWLNGTPGYWWFSDKAISEHTRHTLTLTPGQ